VRRVLIAEDDAELAAELGEALRGEGCFVGTAGDGPRALERLRAEPWHVLLLDNKLPGLSGLELLARHREWFSAPAVFMITGSLDIDDRLEHMGLGPLVARVFTKPFDYQDLQRAVREAVG